MESNSNDSNWIFSLWYVDKGINLGMRSILNYLFCWFDLFCCCASFDIYILIYLFTKDLFVIHIHYMEFPFRLVRLNCFTQIKWTCFVIYFQKNKKKKPISKRETHNNWIYAEQKGIAKKKKRKNRIKRNSMLILFRDITIYIFRSFLKGKVYVGRKLEHIVFCN